METESVQLRASGIQKPSKVTTGIPRPGSISNINGLHEMTSSQSNVRSQPSSSIPAAHGLKRSVPAPAVQSDAKRVPLSKRAGEHTGVSSTTYQPSQSLRGMALKDAPRANHASFNGSSLSRHNSTSSYSSSTSSYAASINSGYRPSSRSQYSHSRTRSAVKPGRPATSMGTREEGQTKTNNGTVPPVAHIRAKPSYNKLPGKKIRKPHSIQGIADIADISYEEPLSQDREVSLSNRFQSLSLNKQKTQIQGNQANSNPAMPPPLTTAIPQTTPRRKRLSTVDLYQAQGEEAQTDQVVPTTPARKILDQLEIHWNNIKKTPITTMSPSPRKGPYLSKYSNTTGYVVSEIEEKLGKMDSEFQQLKEFMSATEKSSFGVKEELEIAKKRVANLEDQRNELQIERARLMDKLSDAERQVRNLNIDIQDQQRRHDKYCEEIIADHERKLRTKVDDYEREMDKVAKLQQEFEEKCGVEAEARLDNLSHENKELRSVLERQKRDHEHEIRLLNVDLDRQSVRMRDFEDTLRKSEEEQRLLQAHIDENLKTIDRLRKRAEDAEESLSKDKGHLGGQISLLSQKLDISSERIQSLEEQNKVIQLECERRLQEIEQAAQKKIDEETNALRNRLIKEEERRHKLFEQVQELKGNIRVMCRIKPPADKSSDTLIKFNPRMSELDEDKIDGLTIPTEREDFRMPGKMIAGEPKDFNFERVFDDNCTNKDVFDEISQLVQSVMDGKKVCIFCYGQTGSGKTYTMSRKEDGIIPRTQDMIFSEVDRLKVLGWEYTVEGSYLEVYQDKLYDLLASRSAKPEPLTVDPISEELNIKGHSFTLLKEERDLDEMIRTADNNRHTAATAMNDRSSRSHSILVLKIRGVKKNEDGEIIRTRKGTLNLIDLAGSESPDKARGEQIYREGVEINSSLSYLRTVLSRLGQGKTEGVDFRSYTLTQLLRPSLGKGCRTLMFVMVSPLKENENETIRSLEFAKDAQKVKMGGNGGAAKSKK